METALEVIRPWVRLPGPDAGTSGGGLYLNSPVLSANEAAILGAALADKPAKGREVTAEDIELAARQAATTHTRSIASAEAITKRLHERGIDARVRRRAAEPAEVSSRPASR